MARYVGALDQGTTSTRFMIFDHAGAVVAVDQKEHEQIYPKPGWVEHDANEIWTRSVEVIRGGLAKAGITASDLAAVGVTNQRETTVVWDRRTGQAHPQRDRLAGHPHRRHLQRARQGRRAGSPSPEGRPAPRHLLLRPQGQVDAGERRRGPGQGRGRRPALRQHRHLVHLEPHRRRRRRRPRDGRLQRQPHHADEPRDPRLGSRHPASSWASRAPCCRPSRPPARCTGRPSAIWPACPWRATWATSRRPSSARRASAPARRRTPTAPAASCS